MQIIYINRATEFNPLYFNVKGVKPARANCIAHCNNLANICILIFEGVFLKADADIAKNDGSNNRPVLLYTIFTFINFSLLNNYFLVILSFKSKTH